MHPKFLLAFLCFMVAMAAVLFANICCYRMVSAINGKRSPNNRISPFGWMGTKLHDVVEEYRTVVPDGRLHIYLRLAVGSAAAAMLIFAVSIGFVS